MDDDLDDDGYPTDAALERVATWPIKSRADADALIGYVRELWRYPEYFDIDASDTWQVSTGGWSGNESLIEALNRNFMFWSLCWLAAKRGGHYQFNTERLPVPKDR